MTEPERLVRQHPRYPHADFPNALTLDPGITRGALSRDAKVLWALLDTYARDNEAAWPGQERLAWDLDVSERTVRRWITELRDHGWLEIRPHLIRGRKVGNEYVLIVINPAANERILARRQARPSTDRTGVTGPTERPSVTGTDRTGVTGTDRTNVTGPKEKQSTEKQSTENTPPTPLSEGGAVEVIEGTIEDGESTTTDPLRGHRWSAKLTRRGGAPTEQEHAAAGEVFDAWVQSPEVLGRPRRSGAVLTGDRIEVIVHRLRDGYGVDDLADACRGWTRIPHNRGENERGTRYDSLALLLRDAEHVDRFRDAWRDQHDPADGVRQAALMRQATRNPMLAAAAAAAPEGMDRDPLRDRDVIDALDEATLRWREDEVRAGRTPTKDMPQEMRDAVVREALAARAVPC